MKSTNLFKISYKFIFLLSQVLLLGLFNSCEDNSNNTVEPKFEETGSKAIVILVENAYIISAELNNFYPLFKTDADKLLSGIFGISEDSLKPLQIDEIIERYGEAWQIREIRAIADLHYDKVVILTDETSNYKNFIDSLSLLSSNYKAIDVILNTHGTDKSILFGSDLINSSTISTDLKSHSINIRTIYQTCCFGASTMRDFVNAGIYSINGSVGENNLSLFSAKLFLEKWCAGSTFSQAVQWAYTQEIEEIKMRTKDLGFAQLYFNFSQEQLASSSQKVSGRFTNLFFNQIKVKE